MNGIEQGIGTDIVVWFQSWGVPVVAWVLAPFHFIGGEYGYLVLLPIVYWAISKRDGKRLMLLAIGSALVGQFLKFTFRRPRPFQVAPDRVTMVFSETGYGIPSGHTLLGTVVAGYFWYRFPRTWVRVTAVTLAVLMGISRMINGVHFPQDVLAGAVVGVVLVVLFWWLDTRYSDALSAWSLGRKLLVALGVGVAAFVLALVVEQSYEGRKEMLSITGAMVGGLVGFALETRYVRFTSGGAPWLRVNRTILGLVLTVGIFLGLDVLYYAIAAGATGIGALVLYVVRYGLVALFVAAGAPWIFVRFGLAETEDALDYDAADA